MGRQALTVHTRASTELATWSALDAEPEAIECVICQCSADQHTVGRHPSGAIYAACIACDMVCAIKTKEGPTRR